MAYGIDDIVQQKVEAYRSNPQQLQQRYQQNQELLDLLALQKIKSEKDAAARDMQMKMQQQPGTIKQQLEQQLVEQTKQDLVNQTKGIMDQRQQRAQQNVQKLTQGIGGRPGTMRMAQGGIVGYAQGSSVSSKAQGGISPEEFERYVQDIKDKEHFKGQAYKLEDHKGGKEQYYTIGYGDYGSHVKQGDTVDKATAEQRLRARLRNDFIPQARNMFPDFDTYSPELRRSLIQSIYRGGITGSPETRRLMNRGEFGKAATEFLDNDEYRAAKSGKVNPGVAPRMEELAKLLQAEAGKTQQPAAMNVPTPRARPEQPAATNVPTPRARPTGIASIGAKTPFYGRDLPPNLESKQKQPEFYGRDLPPNLESKQKQPEFYGMAPPPSLQDRPKMESKRGTSIMEGIRQLLGITATDRELEPIIPSIIEMIKRTQKTKGYQEGGQVKRMQAGGMPSPAGRRVVINGKQYIEVGPAGFLMDAATGQMVRREDVEGRVPTPMSRPEGLSILGSDFDAYLEDQDAKSRSEFSIRGDILDSMMSEYDKMRGVKPDPNKRFQYFGPTDEMRRQADILTQGQEQRRMGLDPFEGSQGARRPSPIDIDFDATLEEDGRDSSEYTIMGQIAKAARSVAPKPVDDYFGPGGTGLPESEPQILPEPEQQLGPKTEPQLGSKSEDMMPKESGLRGILEQDIMRRMQGQRAPEVERLMKERDALLASRQKPGLMSVLAGIDPYARTFGSGIGAGLNRRNKILAEQFEQDIGRIGADISSAEALRDKGLTGGIDLRETDLTEKGQILKAEANKIAETTNRIAASSLDFSRKQTALNTINNSIARLNQQVQEEILASLPLKLQMKSPGSYTEEDREDIRKISNTIRARYAEEIRIAEAARNNLAEIMGIDAREGIPSNFDAATVTKD